MELLNRPILAMMPLIPTSIMRRLALRYIAGETLESALVRLEDLRARGFPGVLDLLGERVKSEAEARNVAATYVEAARVAVARDLDAYISIKPTHVGMHLSEDLSVELYAQVAEACRELGVFVRVEMEEAQTVDATLRVYERLRDRFDNVGTVLQSRLFRTPADVERLASERFDVRVVKGVYLEPAQIAHTEHRPIADAFVAMVDALARRGARIHLATHDAELAERCIETIRRHGLPAERWELEVLLGVQEPLWERWKAAGHPVRVYVPYGPDWRAYSLRRFRKNPQILQHVVRDTLRLA